ncbi:MAG: GNAT family N-acetyltransferase [Chloroflexi bacterium]|nr:GNAT family N-acetyltransferase [Chloroflexota bacterium]
MSEIKIRATIATDLPRLMALDHSCGSEYVWQMDLGREDGQVQAAFRQVRLPRSVAVAYPRPVQSLADEWNRRVGMFTAVAGENLVGYLRLTDRMAAATAWVTDLAVAPRYRRRGIATDLVFAAQAWALERKNGQMMLEIPSKNNPAFCLAQKLGFEFCGYNDHYYITLDVALFFCRALR